VERTLDPTLPANQKTIRWLQRDWESHQLLGRLNLWGYVVLGLVTATCPTVLSELLKSADVNVWIRVLVGTVVIVVCARVYPILLRQRWARGLLREEPSDSDGSPRK
jgi:hypothetical protein